MRGGGAPLGPVRPGDDPSLAAAWYGVLFWYRRRCPAGQAGKTAFFCTPWALLALTFALFAQSRGSGVETHWPRSADGNSNGGLAGDGGVFRWDIRNVGGAFPAVMGGLFGYLGALVQALGSIRASPAKDAYVLGALLVCVPLLMVVFSPAHIGGCAVRPGDRRAADWFDEHLALWAPTVDFRLLVAPFLFGLFTPCGGRSVEAGPRPVEGLSMEAAGPVTVLAVLDVLCAFFLAVQCAALFRRR